MVADFRPNLSLLPQNVDAEESLLGCILLDPEAIKRVESKLRPEAFYIQAHAQIYKAALAVSELAQGVDLISVTTWLYDHKLLEKVGGQCRLAEILERTVSSINVDRYADLVIDKYIRRQLIAAGNEIVRFGYESFRKLPEIFTEAKERISSLVDSPLLSGEDPDQLAYNKLCLEIQQIELGCADPGMKLWKLQKLAQQYGRSVKQLEALYFMSLLKEENESLLTWKELSDRYGDQVREWLLHGFLPKGVTTILHAKGGVGKTRLAYDMVYSLLTGASWNGFPTTGKRRVVIIQTDESGGDMMDALRKRGFDETLENVRYKTRWTFEHIPQLMQDIQEFQPEVIVIDSITSVSRHSLFSENDVQYARPILKLKDLAQMFGCTIVIVHHSSKLGEARGTSAIFNSVSEVWKLERDLEDKSPDSTKRLLTIEKSRSRRPTTYKLDFEPDQGSWTLLGEAGIDENNPDLSTKERIVKFLLENFGSRFESEEIAHEVGGALSRVRLCCNRLAADGIVSQAKGARGRGKAARYFIGTENDRPPSNKMIAPPSENDRGGLQILKNDKMIAPPDHFISLAESGVEQQNDRPIIKKTTENELEGGKKNDRPIILESEPSHSKENKMIALNDRLNDRPPEGDHLIGTPDHLIGTPDQEKGWTKKLFGAIKESISQPPGAIQRRYPDKFKEIQPTPIPFKKGDRVWYDDPQGLIPGNYTIESCGRTQARLEGVSEAVNVEWLFPIERESFVELTDEDLEDMAESGHIYPPDPEEADECPAQVAPYHLRTNPPKKGDRVRSGSGKAGQITQTRKSNPKYEIPWEDGRVMGYDFKDLEDIDIRRVD